MKNSENTVATTCLGMLVTDEPWQDFGFPKRPRYGAYFQRFRPRWKVDLENRIIQEMLAVFTAAYVVADRIAYENVPHVLSIYFEKAEVVKALGYESRDEGAQHLINSITKYKNLPLREWHTAIWGRINSIPIPDKKLSARLLVGCIQFARNVEGMVLTLNS
jgi:hypothetical protein